MPLIVGHGEEFAPHWAFPAIDWNVGHSAIGIFHDGKQRLVVAVNVLADFELAAVIDKSRLVGNVNRQQRRKRDIDFAVTKQRVNAVLRQAVVWAHQRQHDLGIFQRILDPHAAVTFRAFFIGKQLPLI
jgi:hypothetical protein